MAAPAEHAPGQAPPRLMHLLTASMDRQPQVLCNHRSINGQSNGQMTRHSTTAQLTNTRLQPPAASTTPAAPRCSTTATASCRIEPRRSQGPAPATSYPPACHRQGMPAPAHAGPPNRLALLDRGEANAETLPRQAAAAGHLSAGTLPYQCSARALPVAYSHTLSHTHARTHVHTRIIPRLPVHPGSMAAPPPELSSSLASQCITPHTVPPHRGFLGCRFLPNALKQLQQQTVNPDTMVAYCALHD